MALGYKTGGRVRKVYSLHDLCSEKKINVFEEMLDIAIAEAIPDKRFTKFKELAQYLYAKPKDLGDTQFTPEQIRQLIREWTKDADEEGSGRTSSTAG